MSDNIINLHPRAWRKNGNFTYKRYCRLSLVENCVLIFETKRRRTHHHVHACPKCVERLVMLKLNVARYWRMNKEHTYKETGEWKDAEHCLISVEEETPIFLKEKNELVGSNKQVTTALAKREDLEFNLNEKKKMVSKIVQELDDFEAKKEKFGKKPVKTSEMVRLQRNIEDLQKINEFDRLDGQIQEKISELENKQKWIKEREALLSQAPPREN